MIKILEVSKLDDKYTYMIYLSSESNQVYVQFFNTAYYYNIVNCNTKKLELNNKKREIRYNGKSNILGEGMSIVENLFNYKYNSKLTYLDKSYLNLGVFGSHSSIYDKMIGYEIQLRNEKFNTLLDD